MKFFNTAGPVNQSEHYKIDPLTRWDLEEILTLIGQKKYFILHAPRQTGKTSCLLALRDCLNAEGRYHCVYANFEAAQTARNDVASGLAAILSQLHERACGIVEGAGSLSVAKMLESVDANDVLGSYLTSLCELSDRPVIVLIDEIDALVGDTLVSVLRQLRSRYDMRPAQFPQSVILCGVRDIKDYRIHRADGEIITGGSCFNIKSESLTLGNFSEDEVRRLYGEHTRESGQRFAEECFPLVMRYTAGQPWLVNALAYEVTFKMKENRDPSVTITAGMFEEAKERLILSRATHLDQLADKLKEDRVRRVIEPMLIGATAETSEDDTQYCMDLGLIRKQESRFVISNDIYKEVVPRELTQMRQDRFGALFHPVWVNPDGSLDTERLFTLFQSFWRENSEIWRQDIAGYVEAAPHLTFQAFLQRVANGNGFIGREYAYGTKRADLVLKWRWAGGEQRVVIELKLITERDSYAAVKAAVLEQTAAYAALCDATEAHVVVFDRRGAVSWEERVFTDSGEFGGVKIKIWAM
jgi:hypothetical protein